MTNPAPDSPPGGHRYRALDSYRFLAALAIVAFHYNYDFRLGLGEASRAFEKLQVYVDFFFVLSGFVIAEGYAGRVATPSAYAGFLRRRLARVYPLHLLTLGTLMAGAGLAALLGIAVDPVIFDPAQIPQTLLLVHAWGTTDHQGWDLPSWSISAELAVYLIFPLLALAARRLGAGATLALSLALWTGTQWARGRLGLFDLPDATTDGAVRALPTFLAGIAVSQALAGARALPRVPWAAAHALFLLPLPLMHLGLPPEAAIALFPATVLCAALAERAHGPRALGARPCLALGHASYALYLVHFPVALLVARVIVPADWLAGPAWLRFALAGGAAATSVALALAVHARFERPAQRLLTRPLPRRAGPVPA